MLQNHFSSQSIDKTNANHPSMLSNQQSKIRKRCLKMNSQNGFNAIINFIFFYLKKNDNYAKTNFTCYCLNYIFNEKDYHCDILLNA